MSKAEPLPKHQPAEIHVDGLPLYFGEICAAEEQGLVMCNVAGLKNSEAGQSLKIHAGSKGDLVFLDMFDDEGHQFVVAITLVGENEGNLVLEFRDQVSETVGTLRRMLKAEPTERRRAESDSEALPQLRKLAIRQLGKIIDNFLLSTSDHLFELSSRPKSMERQDDLYGAMGVVKRGKDDIKAAFLGQIEGFFDQPLKPSEDRDQKLGEMEPTELGLVDIQDFEDSLTIDRIVKMGQKTFRTQEECLTVRFAELIGSEPLAVRLPVHVAQLCTALKESIRDQAIANSVKPEIFNFFADQVIKKLHPFYTSLNAFLRERGINPELEDNLRKHGSVIERLEQEKAQSKNRPGGARAPEDPPAPTDVPSGEETADLLEEARKAGITESAAPVSQTPAVQQARSGQPTVGQPAVNESLARDAATGGNAGSDRAGSEETPAAAAGHFGADQLYRSVIDALNFRRNSPAGALAAEGSAYTSAHRVSPAAGLPAAGSPAAGSPAAGSPAAGSPAAGSPAAGSPAAGSPVESHGSAAAVGSIGMSGDSVPAGADALTAALSLLQHDQQARGQLQQQQSLRQFLSQHQGEMEALAGTQGFAEDSINQLDLVDNLFSDITTDVDVAPDLRPVVRDLQIPLAKLALLEPQFFADRTHPARGVIDRLTRLSSSSNFPNRALESKVSGIVNGIVDGYESDSTVFKSALTELDALSEQQEKALERNVERVVKTLDGQEKIKKAEKAVERVVQRRIRPPRAPKPLVDLIASGWRDLLKITYVKRGPNSKAWKDYIKTLDLLSLWLIEQQKDGQNEEVQVERALEAEPLLDMVHQQISEALPTHVDHEPVLEHLKEVLAGRAELEFVDVEAPPEADTQRPEDIRKKIDNLPRLRRWVRRAEDLETGAWLTYKDDQGARHRMQLAWISEDRDRFVFVNERGQKAADLSNIELARRMSRGVKPPTPSEELPLVDQSMYKTLEHVQKSLSFDKNHDSLTRLINRDTFMEQLEQVLQHAKSKHSNHALLYLDIDKFSVVNDVYDEAIGDQILIEFGKLLAQQHDRKIASARLENDHFAVMLQDRSLEQAITHAELIRSDIESSPLTVAGEQMSFTVSIGVAQILDHIESVEQIIEHGAQAAREAQDAGGNRVSQFVESSASEETYRKEEAVAVAHIKKTLETKNFVLQAQPIARANLIDGGLEVKHYEILTAIKTDRGELHSPQDFIVSAERFGYMVQLDQWVVREVFIWINAMMDQEKEVPSLAINLSGNSVTDDRFMEYLFEQISEYGVGTNKICFEITETGTINNMVKATDFVNEFKNIGCKFSIDDFGTGLASHSYLRDLPVDYVKIDGTFIKEIDNNPKDFAMTKSINDLAHFLGQETIAECAENDAVIAKLREIGVDYIQGWGVGVPAPLAKLSESLGALEK